MMNSRAPVGFNHFGQRLSISQNLDFMFHISLKASGTNAETLVLIEPLLFSRSKSTATSAN
jgi:hypothetical protein